MTKVRFSLSAIEHAISDVYSALDEHSSVSWEQYSEDDLWRELVLCILGSRMKFSVVHAAAECMDRMCLFSSLRRKKHFKKYEKDMVKALSGKYPFYRVRANQIGRAAECIYSSHESIRDLLNSSNDVRGVRRLLASEVAGLGPKQASLFLRNIGYAKHIAVLDIHVLTYLNWVGLTDAPIRSAPTLGKYEILEDSFIQHAYSLGYSPNQFDLAVWVVVKVAKEESKRWE